MKGWRTLALGAATALFGFFQGFDWVTITSDPETLSLVTGGVGLAVVVLRFLSTGPVGTKL